MASRPTGHVNRRPRRPHLPHAAATPPPPSLSPFFSKFVTKTRDVASHVPPSAQHSPVGADNASHVGLQQVFHPPTTLACRQGAHAAYARTAFPCSRSISSNSIAPRLHNSPYLSLPALTQGHHITMVDNYPRNTPGCLAQNPPRPLLVGHLFSNHGQSDPPACLGCRTKHDKL